jgi:lipoprotein-releasing system permease protein
LAFEYFISRRTLKSVVQGKKVSKPIVRISVISIALAVIVNLITVAVVTGFQQEVRQKVSGFGSHIFIMRGSESSIYESEPIMADQSILESLKKDPGVASIYPVAYKPVLFQSKKTEIKYTLSSGKDTSEVQQQVHGAVLKGVSPDYDWSFFKAYLVQGKIPHFNSQQDDFEEVLISQKLAKDLHYKVHDTISAFFVRNQPIMRPFVVAGIYQTGLEEFDKKIVLTDLRAVQELNDWGIKARIEVGDTLANGMLIIRADVTGGNDHYRFDWGDGYEEYSGFTLCPVKDTTVRLIVSDYWSNMHREEKGTSVPDTAYLHIQVKGNGYTPCAFNLDESGLVVRTYLKEDGSEFSIDAGSKMLFFSAQSGKGSSERYVGGFELTVKDWTTLDEVFHRVKKKVDFIPNEAGEVLKATSIKENQRDIFVWLDFLDLNVIIILVLMVLIGIINMGSALLVLILIRSNFIGMMKAMGATNWSIRKIFLYQAGFLIARGLIWGNVIGLGICFAQKYFGFLSLNPEVYYLSQVPIELDVWQWAALNIGTLLICLSALIIPSVVITRIHPVKAIKFN